MESSQTLVLYSRTGIPEESPRKATSKNAAQLQKGPQKFWKYQCHMMVDPQEQQPQ